MIPTHNTKNKPVKWSDLALDYLLEYVNTHNEFMAEDVRNASLGTVPVPRNTRSWGGVFVRAANMGIIKRKSFGIVKNVKAHKTPATLWEVCGLEEANKKELNTNKNKKGVFRKMFSLFGYDIIKM